VRLKPRSFEGKNRPLQRIMQAFGAVF